MREYNYRTVYDWFNDPFPVDCFIPDFNLPPIIIDDSYVLNKRSPYTPDTLLDSNYVAYVKYISTLATISEYRNLFS